MPTALTWPGPTWAIRSSTTPTMVFRRPPVRSIDEGCRRAPSRGSRHRRQPRPRPPWCHRCRSRSCMPRSHRLLGLLAARRRGRRVSVRRLAAKPRSPSLTRSTTSAILSSVSGLDLRTTLRTRQIGQMRHTESPGDAACGRAHTRDRRGLSAPRPGIRRREGALSRHTARTPPTSARLPRRPSRPGRSPTDTISPRRAS